ncbi:hypothetical protein GCM10027048_27600 [Hymenobacter coalescens]
MSPSTPEPPYRQALRDVAADLAGQREQLLRVHGTLALRLGDQATPVALDGITFAPIPGIADMEWALLPAPMGATYSHMNVRAMAGARSPRVSVPHAVRVHVLCGALLWWQASQGHEAGEPAYRRVEAGAVLELPPHEEHGFVVLTPYLSYNVFSPPL